MTLRTRDIDKLGESRAETPKNAATRVQIQDEIDKLRVLRHDLPGMTRHEDIINLIEKTWRVIEYLNERIPDA